MASSAMETLPCSGFVTLSLSRSQLALLQWEDEKEFRFSRKDVRRGAFFLARRQHFLYVLPRRPRILGGAATRSLVEVLFWR